MLDGSQTSIFMPTQDEIALRRREDHAGKTTKTERRFKEAVVDLAALEGQAREARLSGDKAEAKRLGAAVKDAEASLLAVRETIKGLMGAVAALGHEEAVELSVEQARERVSILKKQEGLFDRLGGLLEESTALREDWIALSQSERDLWERIGSPNAGRVSAPPLLLEMTSRVIPGGSADWYLPVQKRAAVEALQRAEADLEALAPKTEI